MKLCDENCCTGCTACVAVCPVKAITMEKDVTGFLYPVIDEKKCINCGACEKLTAKLQLHLEEDEHKHKPLYAYAVKNKDENKRLHSQSGGLFKALSETIIEMGGIVYGCVYGKNFRVEHARVDTKDELYRFSGSKYVQSDMKNCMQNVVKDLQDDRIVLFSGTPCQVAGIETFLRIKKVNTNNFYSCDFICHGVPSPKVYENYLEFMKEKFNSEIIDVNLRDKNAGGWHNHLETIKFKNGKSYTGKIYVDLFYSNLSLRRSCEHCLYTKTNRPSDITIADCWGIEKIKPKLWDDNKGISLALLQTDKGKKLFQQASGKLDVTELNVDQYVQPQLQHPSETPKQKRNFWKDYNKKSFKKILKKYTQYGGLFFKTKRKILKLLKKW